MLPLEQAGSTDRRGLTALMHASADLLRAILDLESADLARITGSARRMRYMFLAGDERHSGWFTGAP